MTGTNNQAVQLCKFVSNGSEEPSLELNVKAFKEIIGKASDKLIAIYCISGKYRSGKSFILGLFLQYLQNNGSADWIDRPVKHSFKYSNSDEGVTSGIWMWSEPFIRKDRSGRQVAVYLMDSQGWHDSNSTLEENAKIFALSSLLSSVMIFNVEKRISETDLKYLSDFSSNCLQMDAKADDSGDEQVFQKLIVLIRDWISTGDEGFPFGFYDNNTKIGGKDFLAKKLKPQSDQTSDAQKLRELIHLIYKEVSACLLPYPGQIVGKNVYKSSKMDPEFRSALEGFVPALFDQGKITTKTIGGKHVTGAELFSLALNWIKTINSNTSDSSYLALDLNKYHQAYQNALDDFETKVSYSISLAVTISQMERNIFNQRYK